MLTEGLPPNHFVFLERYDAEVVGDGVAEFGPFCWQACAEEVENCLGELVGRCIVPIVCDPIVHDAPKALDRVKMRGICWQEMQLHPVLWAVEPWLKYLGMMIAGIVDKDMDGRHGLVVALQLCQHLLGCLGIDLLAFHKGELEGLKVKRALNVEPLAA